MYLGYTCLLAAATLLGAPYWLVRMGSQGKYRAGLGQRMGRYPAGVAEALAGPQPIWVHAVSVGEVLAAQPLVAALRRRDPQRRIAVSTITDTGQATAKQRLPEADAFLYLPLDLPGPVRRSVSRVHPHLFILVETELWPNLLSHLAATGVPVALVNGRLSPGSFRGYRLVRPLMRRVLSSVRVLCMQTEGDAARVIALGADPDRVRVTGNLKFHQTVPSDPEGEGRLVREELHLEPERPVLVAGSTHGGEEEILLDLQGKLRAQWPDLTLVLAPRHPERLREVEALAQRRGCELVRKSELREKFPGKALPEGSVLLVDTMGELGRLYGAATLTFVGGSLVPRGGHNLLEPAAWGKPILFGPHMFNFEHIRGRLLSAEGGRQVNHPEELTKAAEDLLADPARARAMGDRARRMLLEDHDALGKTLACLDPYL